MVSATAPFMNPMSVSLAIKQPNDLESPNNLSLANGLIPRFSWMASRPKESGVKVFKGLHSLLYLEFLSPNFENPDVVVQF